MKKGPPPGPQGGGGGAVWDPGQRRADRVQGSQFRFRNKISIAPRREGPDDDGEMKVLMPPPMPLPLPSIHALLSFRFLYSHTFTYR